MSIDNITWKKFTELNATLSIVENKQTKFDECSYFYPELISDRYLRVICDLKIQLGDETVVSLFKKTKKDYAVRVVRVEKIEELSDREVQKKYAVIFEVIEGEFDINEEL